MGTPTGPSSAEQQLNRKWSEKLTRLWDHMRDGDGVSVGGREGKVRMRLMCFVSLEEFRRRVAPRPSSFARRGSPPHTLEEFRRRGAPRPSSPAKREAPAHIGTRPAGNYMNRGQRVLPRKITRPRRHQPAPPGASMPPGGSGRAWKNTREQPKVARPSELVNQQATVHALHFDVYGVSARC